MSTIAGSPAFTTATAPTPRIMHKLNYFVN